MPFLILRHRSKQQKTSKKTYAAYSYTDLQNKLDADGTVLHNNSLFNADYLYKFSEYTGDIEDKENDESIARVMHADALNFVNYIFYTFVCSDSVGYYTTEDFGYTSFSYSEF